MNGVSIDSLTQKVLNKASSSTFARTVTVSGQAIPKTGGVPMLDFVRLHGQENICDLFAYDIELKTPENWADMMGLHANLDLSAMNGKSLSVSIALDTTGTGKIAQAGSREINGIVTDARLLRSEGRHSLYTVTLRPWLWLATQTSDYRIFQNKNAIEIIDEILKDYAFPAQKKVSASRYPKREYQVQYGENDYQFLARLMQEWGLIWYFEHKEGQHTLVISDEQDMTNPLPGGGSLEYYPPDVKLDHERIRVFAPADRIVSGEWRTNDYDFALPKADLTARSRQPRGTLHNQQDIYQWPGDHAQPATGNDPWNEGNQIARIRMEERRCQGLVAQGSGNIRNMSPGYSFALSRHPQKASNTQHLILSTRLTLEDNADETSGDQHWHCHVDFTTQPLSEVYRPARTFKKPRTRGPQTATVVGPKGQEIWTDNYARVKVHFHWDAYDNRDESSSCWIRVSSPWASQNYGGIQIPRMGDEVIVDFLNGDPDCPIITGRVVNAGKMPPWALPGQQALSGFRSRELQGDGASGNARYNHLLWDDTPGQIQAQLSSDHQLSQLNLGYITRVPNTQGRKDFRGEGFELRTDAWGILRAAKGLMISTWGRMSAAGHHKSLDETASNLARAYDTHTNLADVAQHNQAQEQDRDQSAAVKSIAAQNQDIEGDADKAQSELSKPHLVLSSPASLISNAADSTHISSQKHIALTAGKDLSIAADRSFFASIRKTFKLYVHRAGIKLVAANGDIDLHALTDAINVLAKLKVTVNAKTIEIAAEEEVVINGGGSYIKLTAQGIEEGTAGKWVARAANHSLSGPAQDPKKIPEFKPADISETFWFSG